MNPRPIRLITPPTEGSTRPAVPKLALSPREVAQSLSVSESTARRLIAAGTFGPPLRLGGVVRVPVAAIQRYMDQQTQMGRRS